MTSLMCDRRPGGKVQVHDNNTAKTLSLASLTSDSGPAGNVHLWGTSPVSFTKGSLKRPHSMPAPQPPTVAFTGFSKANSHATSMSAVDPDALIEHALRLQQWLNNKTIKAVQEKSDVEAKTTKKMYESVLSTEANFVKEMERLVQYREMLNTRKKEMLHKTWSENVYEPIRKQIIEQVNGPTYKELAQRKRELHKEYLQHVNKKGHVFLDTIAPDEYYAMSLHPTRPSLLTAETKHLSDPLLSQERHRSEEERIMFRCETGSRLTDHDVAQIRLPPLPLVPQGRHGTECNTWLEMPMGDIESPVRLASRRRMRDDHNECQMNFDLWGKAVEKHVVDDELQIQKRRAFPQESIAEQIHRARAPHSAPKRHVGVQVST